VEVGLRDAHAVVQLEAHRSELKSSRQADLQLAAGVSVDSAGPVLALRGRVELGSVVVVIVVRGECEQGEGREDEAGETNSLIMLILEVVVALRSGFYDHAPSRAATRLK
jgi:hypothetical protein